jgi:hypothetical protein
LAVISSRTANFSATRFAGSSKRGGPGLAATEKTGAYRIVFGIKQRKKKQKYGCL